MQVDLDVETKKAAEAQAALLGYVSLAAMLRVVATGLARDYRANPDVDRSAKALSPTVAAAKIAIPKTTNLPPPEQFTHWPAHISRDIYRTDRELYRLLIETGEIH